MALKIALLVEDDLGQQAAMRSSLLQEGWECYVASTAAEGLALTISWLARSRASSTQEQIAVVLDLSLDLPGLHLVALLDDLRQRGLLAPAWIIALSESPSAEIMRLSRIAGCDALSPKPLSAELLGQLGVRASWAPEVAGSQERMLRRWLISEGQRLLAYRMPALARSAQPWSLAETEDLLKEISGKGWRSASQPAGALLQRLGGERSARTLLGMLLPQLASPYDRMLAGLLAGCSIGQSGRRLGYGRSHSYELFHELAAVLCTLLSGADQRRSLIGGLLAGRPGGELVLGSTS